jgi:enamine deaminase RidA (YjgF/YER057c/UK114 family)
MKHIETGLPRLAQPFSWAVEANRTIFTAHGPVDADGRIVGGAIEDQARLTFRNLEQALHAAGAGLRDVAQVLIYMRRAKDMPAIDGVYREFFSEPWPNRSSVGGLDFVHPDMDIEIVVYAALPTDAS